MYTKIKEIMADIPDGISVVAVSKFQSIQKIEDALKAGINVFGENYVNELLEKQAHFGDRAKFHFIGHLQTNKVKSLVGKAELIQSVDSIKLAKEIQKHSCNLGIITDVLIQVNTENEQSKGGISVDELYSLLPEIAGYKNIKVRGLMVIPPIYAKTEDTKKVFDNIYDIFIDIRGKKLDNVSMEFLSMGMSADYKEAIACGSNMVRIGTKIFGKR